MKKHLHGKRHMIARRSVGEGRRKRASKKWNKYASDFSFRIGSVIEAVVYAMQELVKEIHKTGEAMYRIRNQIQ